MLIGGHIEDKALSAENPGQRPWAAISLPQHSLQSQLGERKVQWGQCLLLGRASIQLTSTQMRDSGSASKQHQKIGSSPVSFRSASWTKWCPSGTLWPRSHFLPHLFFGVLLICYDCCLHQQLLATCYHLKSLKLKFFLNVVLTLTNHIHQTVHTGNTSIGAESAGQQCCSFLPEDPSQKEAILNSTHS